MSGHEAARRADDLQRRAGRIAVDSSRRARNARWRSHAGMREHGAASFQYSVCSSGVKDDAGQIAPRSARSGQHSITGLSDLLTKLRDDRRAEDRRADHRGIRGGRHQTIRRAARRMAAAARASLYVMHLNDTSFDTNSGRRRPSGIEDRRIGVIGLEALSKVGARHDVHDERRRHERRSIAFRRKMSGYYLLGIEPDRARSRWQGRIRSKSKCRGTAPSCGRARQTMLNAAPAVDRRHAAGGGRGRSELAAADVDAAASCRRPSRCRGRSRARCSC